MKFLLFPFLIVCWNFFILNVHIKNPLRHLCAITGSINPYGINPITFPNMLENTASTPSCSLYIQNLRISRNGIRLYRYTLSSAATLPYSSKKNRKYTSSSTYRRKSMTPICFILRFVLSFNVSPCPASDQNL